MKVNFDSEKPIYIQIAEQIEDAIFTGIYEEETQIPSTTEISAQFKINPATVLKGMNILVDDKVIYKKRGVGMFVSEGAVMTIKEKRKGEFFENYIGNLINEAKKIGFSMNDIIKLIERGYN